MTDSRQRKESHNSQKLLAASDRQHALLWTLVGSLLGMVLLYAATRKVESAQLLLVLKSVDLRWGVAVFLAVPVFVAIKTWRWAILLKPVPGARYADLHSAVYVGLAVNFIIVHVGELLRAAIVARTSRISVSTVLATVVVEKALDFLAILLLLVGLSFFVSELAPYVHLASYAIGAAACVIMLLLIAMLHPPQWLQRWTTNISNLLQETIKVWLLSQFEKFRSGLAGITDRRIMSAAIGLAVAQWILVVAAVWWSGLAAGAIQTPMSLATTFVIIVLGLSVPNAPLQIGSTQLAFAIGLGMNGTEPEIAISASLVYTAFLIIPTMMIGGLYLMRLRVSWNAQNP